MTDVDKNAKLVRVLIFVVIVMFGFGFALVPLYDVLCKVTGLNGKGENLSGAVTKEVAYPIDQTREVNVELMSTVNQGAPLEFYPEVNSVKVHPGAYYRVNFFAKNKTDKTMIARAIPSISPGLAAQYFEKTECFCFNEQVFKAGEKKSMPVRFVVKPDLPKDYKTITLSYTFFNNTDTVQK